MNEKCPHLAPIWISSDESAMHLPTDFSPEEIGRSANNEWETFFLSQVRAQGKTVESAWLLHHSRGQTLFSASFPEIFLRVDKTNTHAGREKKQYLREENEMTEAMTDGYQVTGKKRRGKRNRGKVFRGQERKLSKSANDMSCATFLLLLYANCDCLGSHFV